MERRDIQAFLARDWALLESSKAEYWAERKRRLGPAEGLRIADELRRQTIALRPDFPSEEEREEDIACHARVAALLRAASERRR